MLLILLITFGCVNTNEVKFMTPQPDNTDAINSFKNKIQGEYISLQNPEKILTVSDKLIITNQTMSFSYLISDLRSELENDQSLNFDINNDQQIIDYFKDHFKSNEDSIKIINDSIFCFFLLIDTLFDTENQILKKFKSSYYLNYEMDDAYWSVKKLYLKRDTLYLGEIYPGDTLLRFNFVEKLADSTVNDSAVKYYNSDYYLMLPSKRQFKKTTKSGIFETNEKYYKIK